MVATVRKQKEVNIGHYTFSIFSSVRDVATDIQGSSPQLNPFRSIITGISRGIFR